jgi:hypothetical protein
MRRQSSRFRVGAEPNLLRPVAGRAQAQFAAVKARSPGRSGPEIADFAVTPQSTMRDPITASPLAGSPIVASGVGICD